MTNVFDPSVFGPNQWLTLAGLVLTATIAAVSLRTFNSWKREKIEERKIELAFDALAIAYESRFIFGHISTAFTFAGEHQVMEKLPGESDDEWSRRGTYHAIFKRIEANKEFFDRVWKLQPRFMAAFGPGTEEIFLLLHQSRRDVEVAAGMLGQEDKMYREGNDKLQRSWKKAPRDLWPTGEFEPEKDVVSRRLEDFQKRMEKICKPIIDREYVRMQKNEERLSTAREAVRLMEESRKKRKSKT
jgi:hypothetical protein